jgi:hypothetical protein
MFKRVFAAAALVIAAFVFAMSLLASVSGAGAQGMAATPGAGDATGGFPAHIHSGTCATLGDVVYPLNNLTRAGADMPMDATPGAMMSTPVDMTSAATPGAMSGQMAPIASSSTVVEASLDDILGAEHAINVHESMENIQNYIACGDLTGSATNGELTIELQELNDSGFMGQAVLVDNGDGTTTVTVALTSSGAEAATPEATPSS